MQTTLDDVCMIVLCSAVQNYIIFGLFRIALVLLDKFTRFNVENELYEISSKRAPAIFWGYIHVHHTKMRYSCSISPPVFACMYSPW